MHFDDFSIFFGYLFLTQNLYSSEIIVPISQNVESSNVQFVPNQIFPVLFTVFLPIIFVPVTFVWTEIGLTDAGGENARWSHCEEMPEVEAQQWRAVWYNRGRVSLVWGGGWH